MNLTTTRRPVKSKIITLSLSVLLIFIFLEMFIRALTVLGYRYLPFKLIAPLSININSVRKKVTSDDRFFSLKHPELGFVIKPSINISYRAKEIGRDVPSVSYVTIDVFGDNSFGARDDGIDKEFWAVALGDSYAFCYSIDLNQCWTEIIERETGKDVLNLGTPGTGTYHQYKIFEHFLKRYKEKPRFVFLMFNFTDHLDDQCYLQRKNCNVFSPNTAFLFNDSLLGNSFTIGAIKTILDIIRTKKIYSQIMEPEISHIKNIESICSCNVVLIPAYNYFKNLRICSSFHCVRIYYTPDMFMKEHHNEKAQIHISHKILEYLKHTFGQNL